MYAYILYVLLKALPPVCMKYTARDESRVANRQSRVLYLSQDSHQELYTFIQTKWQCFKCFIVFYTNLTHFPNKQTGFFVEMCQ